VLLRQAGKAIVDDQLGDLLLGPVVAVPGLNVGLYSAANKRKAALVMRTGAQKRHTALQHPLAVHHDAIN
jgi:hypothetical protein